MGQIVQMPDIVTFKFKARAMRLAKPFHHLFDILEGIAENVIGGAFQIGLFPIIFEFLHPCGRRCDVEIHRTHIQAAHFGLGQQRCG